MKQIRLNRISLNIVTFLVAISVISCEKMKGEINKNDDSLNHITKKSDLKIELKWKWSQNNIEIYHPKLFRDKEIVFTRKFHCPDGVEGEIIGAKESQKLIERGEREPRFADPEVTLVNLSNNHLEVIDWGWDPSFSIDGTKIIYSYQVKPLTGYRTLANTMSGNEITVYDRSKKTKNKIIMPSEGYYSNPEYSADEKYIYFDVNGSVNGDYGGKTGNGVYEISGNKINIEKDFIAKDKNVSVSPNGTFVSEINKDNKNIFKIFKKATPLKYEEFNTKGKIDEVSWSKDSNYLILVDTIYSDKDNYLFANDEIIILTIK